MEKGAATPDGQKRKRLVGEFFENGVEQLGVKDLCFG